MVTDTSKLWQLDTEIQKVVPREAAWWFHSLLSVLTASMIFTTKTLSTVSTLADFYMRKLCLDTSFSYKQNGAKKEICASTINQQQYLKHRLLFSLIHLIVIYKYISSLTTALWGDLAFLSILIQGTCETRV